MSHAQAHLRADRIRGHPHPVARPAAIMGILNLTPDSFSDGGRFADPITAHRAALAMAAAGASWVDIGGESTRPGARLVSAASECARVLPLLEAVVEPLRDAGTLVSLDTSKAAVARAGLAAGVAMINDVAAGRDPEMFACVAEAGAALCLMHMRGDPQTMQQEPVYPDVLDTVTAFLEQRLAAACAAGVDEAAIVVDPGIGFGKTVDHNCRLLHGLEHIAAATGRPVLVGISRKSLIPALLDTPSVSAERDEPSHLLHAALAPRCDILRVHDVAGALRAVRLGGAISPGMPGP
ncbi:MAG: dihydropteroate synthase [Planctomycetota bacterium]